MHTKKSFTLVELIIVIIIVGILAAIAVPNFSAIKEKSLDKEAKSTLALIQAAEKIYKLESNVYYPNGASTSVVNDLNTYLKLSLPATAVTWSYTADATATHATATRAVASGRVWTLPFTNDTYTCTGADCP